MKINFNNQKQFRNEFHNVFREKLANYHDVATGKKEAEVSYTTTGAMGKYLMEHIVSDAAGIPLIGPFAADFISTIPTKIYEYYQKIQIQEIDAKYQEQILAADLGAIEAVIEETAYEVARIFQQQIAMIKHSNDVLKLAQCGVEKIFQQAKVSKKLQLSTKDLIHALVSDEQSDLGSLWQEKVENYRDEPLKLSEMFVKPGLRVEVSENKYVYKQKLSSDLKYGYRGEIFDFDEQTNSYTPSKCDQGYVENHVPRLKSLQELAQNYAPNLHLVQQTSIDKFVRYLVIKNGESPVSFISYLKLSENSKLVFRGVNFSAHSNLSYGDFSNCDMTRLSFCEVNLQHCILTDSRIILADFKRSNLEGGWLKNTDLRWSKFEGANFCGEKTMLLNARFDYATLDADTDFTDNPYFIATSKEGALIGTNKITLTTNDKFKSLENVVNKAMDELNIQKQSLVQQDAAEFYNVRSSLYSFVGRESILKEINDNFKAQAQVVQVIGGLGGMGKTQTALKYVQEHAQEYNYHIRWLGAESEAILEENFKEFASVLGFNTPQASMKEVIKFVKDKLATKQVLLIFDNVEDANIVRKYLPANPTSTQHVLITTRKVGVFKNAMKSTGDKVITLDSFLQEESFVYVRSIIEEASSTDAKNLANIFDNIPLALAQSVAYIKNNGISIKEYLIEFNKLKQQQQQDLLQDKSTEVLTSGHEQNIYTTLSLSLDYIDLYPQAILFLKICAYLNADAIPLNIFPSIFYNYLVQNQNIAILQAYSLISVKVEAEEPTIYIHRLLQEVIQKKVKNEGGKKEEIAVLREAASALKDGMYINDSAFGTDDEVFKKNAPLMNHANSLLKHVEPYLIDTVFDNNINELLQAYVADIYKTCGYFYGATNQTDNAIKYVERAFKLQKCIYTPRNPEYIKTDRYLKELKSSKSFFFFGRRANPKLS